MDRTTLTFSFENIVTVCIMVALGFAVFGMIGRVAHRVAGPSDV